MASHGSIYLVAFIALFCFGAHASGYFGDSATTLVTGVSWVESAVPATSTGGAGYYVSQQAPSSGLRWYPNSGSSVTLSTDVSAGLAINAAGTKLWVMQAGSKVTEWDVASNSLAATYTLGFDGGVGGGLCLDGTETTLYATGHGWEITPQGQVQMDSASDVNGVASIDLSTGTVTNLKTNEPADYAFNGCVVDGNTLYAVQFQRGVGSYDISTGTWTQTLDWSSELVALQDGSGGDPNLAGDGLTLNDGTFYVSMWNLRNLGQATTSNSAIWACNPSCTTSCCTKLEPSAFAAADIGNFNGQLVIPEIINGEVSYRPFAADGTTTGGMMGSTTTGGMMGSTTTSDMMGSTTEMATTGGMMGSTTSDMMGSTTEMAAPIDKAARPFLGLGLALVTSTLAAVVAAVAPPVS